ncbi:MAG TPA: hypothetical protein VKB93_08255 [Thermoanaerobaculia bacterium]|nr:hypothetical protein [Thermoanaerobaculia bacterium]
MPQNEWQDGGDDAARKKSRAWNLIALLFGWTLFLYWWWVVLRRTDHVVAWRLVTGLMLLASFLVAFSLIWILHNLWLARRGRRNRATPYNAGVFERDKLDRPVMLGDLHVLREAPVVIVTADRGQKRYVEGEAEDIRG